MEEKKYLDYQGLQTYHENLLSVLENSEQATAEALDNLDDRLKTIENKSPYSKSEIDNLLEPITDKLDDIEEFAEVNVLSDWNETNSNSDAYIKNKPDVKAIEDKIPSTASSTNQLADKEFVNSSISTSTATFRGTSATDLTEQQFLTWANGLTKDANDYVFWNTVDSAGTPQFKRYKYNGTAWVYEYTLNNSSFTADQWAAINSAITSADVTKLEALPTNAELETALAGKQATLTFDSAPTSGSSNPVTSNGIYEALTFETVNVNLSVIGNGSNASDIIGVPVLIKNTDNNSVYLNTTWQGMVLKVLVPVNINCSVIVGNNVSGYFVKNTKTFTTLRSNVRTVNFSYGVTPGIYIEDVEHNLYTSQNWDTNKVANAIIILSSSINRRFSINNSPSLAMIDDATRAFETYNPAPDSKFTDYDGQGNTNKMTQAVNELVPEFYESSAQYYANNYIFPDGITKGYIGAYGEWYLAIQNFTEFSNALAACSGDAFDYQYTSTFKRVWGSNRCLEGINDTGTDWQTNSAIARNIKIVSFY